MKKKNLYKRFIAVITSFILLLSIMPMVAPAECVGQNCGGDLSITVGNEAPTIPTVNPISAVTLNGLTTKDVTVVYTASDDNGYLDLDFATASVSLSKGATTRTASSCNPTANATTTSTITCTVTLQFYDDAGADWVVNATIDDLASASGLNDSTTATVNALDYVDQDVSAVSWSSVSVGSDDNEADNSMTLQNGGNQDYASFDITGYNATGGVYADIIEASQFSVDEDTGQSSGQIYMVDSTPVDVSAQLLLNAHGASETEEVFFYLDVPSGISPDTYTSDTSWVIALS